MDGERHFVLLLIPMKSFHGEREIPIEKWDVDEAIKITKDITDSNGNAPYGFQFITRGPYDDKLGKMKFAMSCNYYFSGEIETRDQIIARNDPKEKHLRKNMTIGSIERVIAIDCNTKRVHLEFRKCDVILDVNIREEQDVGS